MQERNRYILHIIFRCLLYTALLYTYTIPLIINALIFIYHKRVFSHHIYILIIGIGETRLLKRLSQNAIRRSSIYASIYTSVMNVYLLLSQATNRQFAIKEKDERRAYCGRYRMLVLLCIFRKLFRFSQIQLLLYLEIIVRCQLIHLVSLLLRNFLY